MTISSTTSDTPLRFNASTMQPLTQTRERTNTAFVLPPRAAWTRAQGPHGQLDAPHQFLKNDLIALIAETGVLDAGLENGIIVHLDHVNLLAELLEVHAVKSIADRVRGLERDHNKQTQHQHKRPGLE